MRTVRLRLNEEGTFCENGRFCDSITIKRTKPYKCSKPKDPKFSMKFFYKRETINKSLRSLPNNFF